MQNFQAKNLTFGAIMIALFSLLLVVAVYVPFINMVASLFVVLPIAWYSAVFNRTSAIFIAISGCVLATLIGGIPLLPFALIFAALGVVMGDAIRMKRSKLFLFMSSGLTVLLVTSILYLVFVNFIGVDIVRESIALSKDSYKEYIETSQKTLGATAVSEKEMMAAFNMVEYAIPAVVTMSVFFVTFIIQTVNLPILKRLGLHVPQFAPFKDMRLPRSILWYYLIVLTISLFAAPPEGSMLHIGVLNISIVLWMLLVLQGVSLLFYYIHEKGLPNIVKVIVVFLAIPLYSFVALIGILDLGFNIRSYVTGKNQK